MPFALSLSKGLAERSRGPCAWKVLGFSLWLCFAIARTGPSTSSGRSEWVGWAGSRA